MKPQIASRAETSRPSHETDIGTPYDPTCTGHRFKSLARCTTATNTKISAEIAA
jgi:hypothetical protein